MTERTVNYTYINGDQNNYPTAANITVNHHHYGEQREHDKLVIDPNDPLSGYIPQQKLRKVAEDVAAQCFSPQEVLAKLVPLLKGACELPIQTICSKAFIEAIALHLTNIKGANYENLKKVLNINNM